MLGWTYIQTLIKFCRDSNSEGSWSDPVVTATINSHNQAAAAGKPGPQLELSATRGHLFGPPTSE